jgi:hypothetical protein
MSAVHTRVVLARARVAPVTCARSPPALPRRAGKGGEQGARREAVAVAALGRRDLASVGACLVSSAAAAVALGGAPALAESFSYDGNKPRIGAALLTVAD